MLAFFPAPIGDELLYSMLARYRDLSGLTESEAVLEAAFGSDRSFIHVGLPCALVHLARALPDVDWMPDDLANRLTILPYFARFLSPEVHDGVQHGMMRGGSNSRGFGHLDRTVGQVEPVLTMRFCSTCVVIDQASAGMSAWRRVHQLPGVYVCPEHGTPLRTSRVQTTFQHRLMTCPADPDAGRQLASPIGHDDVARSLARNSEWLLLNPGLPTSPEDLHAEIRSVLLRSGLASTSRRSVGQGLREAMARKFGAENLEALGCRIGTVGSPEPWLRSMEGSRTKIRAHPLHYLLLLELSGMQVKDLFFIPQLNADTRDKKITSRFHNRPDPALAVRYKAEVLSLTSAYPEARMSALRKCSYWAFEYLACHEKTWLEAKLTGRESRSAVDGRDWDVVDAFLLPRIQAAIARMKSTRVRPIRLSMRRIAAEAQIPPTLILRATEIPRSTAAARAAEEDEVTHAKRCLDWAASELLKEGKPVGQTRLFELAKVRGETRRSLEEYSRTLFERPEASGVDGGPDLPKFPGQDMPGEYEGPPQRRDGSRSSR